MPQVRRWLRTAPVLASSLVAALVLHWNGHTWSRQASANLGTGSNQLAGVDASGPANLWAVGGYNENTTSLNLAVHCC